MLFVFLGGPQLQPYIHSRSDFRLHTTPAVSRSANIGGGGKRPGKFPHAHLFFSFSCQLTAVLVTIEPCILIVLGSLSPLLQPRTTPPGVLTSVNSISVPLRPFSRLRNHIFVRPYPRDNFWHLLKPPLPHPSPPPTLTEYRRRRYASKGQGFFFLFVSHTGIAFPPIMVVLPRSRQRLHP